MRARRGVEFKSPGRQYAIWIELLFDSLHYSYSAAESFAVTHPIL
jgi:hypothetical protein